MGYALKTGERLLSQNLITDDVLQQALARQREIGGRLGTHLFDMGVISRYTLANLLNRAHGLPLLRMGEEINARLNVVAMFPRQFALQKNIVPIAASPKRLLIGAMDLPQASTVSDVADLMRKEVIVRILPESLYHQYRRDLLQVPTDFFSNHVDPSKVEERPFLEGFKDEVGRDLILFTAGGITLAYVRRRKGSSAERLGDMLIEDGLVTQAEIENARAKHPRMHVGEALMEDNLIDARTVSRYLSRHAQCATVDPYHPIAVSPDILKLILPGTARKLLILPLAIHEGNLLVLTADPENRLVSQVAGRESGYNIMPIVSPRAIVRTLIERHYPMKAAVQA